MFNLLEAVKSLIIYRVLGLNSIHFETIEKQNKCYTNVTCYGLCLLAVWPGKKGEGRSKDRVLDLIPVKYMLHKQFHVSFSFLVFLFRMGTEDEVCLEQFIPG